MKSPDMKPPDARRVEEPPPPTPARHADAAPRKRDGAQFVDPYDSRGEPQPEEPGYGHGV